MNENNYYVLSWNDEYLSQAILAGPVSFEEASKVLKETAIERIAELGLDDEYDTTPEHLYELASDEITAYEVDSVDAGQWGTCLRFNGQEERISIVQYDQKANARDGQEQDGTETAAKEAVQAAMENGTMIYRTSARCPRCRNALYTSDILRYPLVCPVCDENFYHIEVREYDSDLFEIHIPMGAEDYREKKEKFLMAAEHSNACFVGYDDNTGLMDLGYTKDQIPSTNTLFETLDLIKIL